MKRDHEAGREMNPTDARLYGWAEYGSQAARDDVPKLTVVK